MIIVFIPLLCFCAFAGWLLISQRKAQEQDNQASESFWSREARANSTRNKDISGLPFLQIAETDLPDTDPGDETIHYYIGLLKENIKQPMIDLSTYSNTDLKLAYGVGNFKTLSSYDENYNTFLLHLTNLARAYSHAELYDEAVRTYRLTLQYGSQKVSDYSELAKTYLKLGERGQVDRLIEETKSGSHPRKASVIKALQEVLSANP